VFVTVPRVANDEPTIEEELYRRVGEGLLGSWIELDNNPLTVGRKGRPWTQAQLLGVHGLAAHAHRLYVPANRLLDEGWVLEALPLIRTAYQCALTAQWIAQAEEANPFLDQDLDQRRQAEHTALRGVPESVRGGHSIAGMDLRDLEASAAGSARDFGRLCGDLIPGGDSAYFGYRVMSMYAEPSVALVDEYLASDAAGEFSGLMLAPREGNRGAWRGVLVATLIWAGRALDYFDMSHRRRTQLRTAARDLGIESALQLSPQAMRRLDDHHRAVREERTQGAPSTDEE
jgi:hypothetical protein